MAASPGGVEVGRISVRVVPDTSRLGPDLKVALDRIEAQTDLTVSTSIDTTLLDAQAKAAVEQAQAVAGNIHIKTEVDTSQVREAESALSAASSSAGNFASSLSGIPSVLALLGPALIPVTAAVVGFAAALAAPIAITGGGLTIFGIMAGFTISETKKQLKVISDLQTKLGGLTKGTQAYADTSAQLRLAQQALTPAQAAFSHSLDGVKRAFDSIPKSIILKPITDGMNLLAKVLPLLQPILRAASGAISDMLGQLDKAASSQGFKDFVSAFAKNLGPDLRSFATITGNVFHGLFGLFGAFNKQLSGSVLKSLENLTGKFAKWGETVGQSKGFKAFVDYIKQVGPKVAQTLGDVADALAGIVKAAAPIGSGVLTAIDGIAKAVGKIPTPVLTALTAFFVSVAGLGVSPEIAATAAGFVLLYQNSKPLRKVLGDLGDFFKTQLLPIIKKAADQILPALKAAFHDISQTIRDNKPFLETMGKLLLVFASAAVVTLILLVAGAIRLVGKAIRGEVTFWHLLADVALIVIAAIIRATGRLLGALLDSFGQIVHGAALAFGWIPGLGGKLKGADAAFHSFTAGVKDNLNAAADNVDAFRHKIDAVASMHPNIKINIDDLVAVKELERLQAFRLKDKTLTVTQRFQLIEQAPGPGGGMGRFGAASPVPVTPPPTTGGPHGPGNQGGPTRGSGDTYNIQAQDYNDFLRQLDNRRRARGGGGVGSLTPAGVR